MHAAEPMCSKFGRPGRPQAMLARPRRPCANRAAAPMNMKSLKPGITLQLFVTVLATAVLGVVMMGFAARQSFDRGFIGYLNLQAVQRLDASIPRLQQAYANRGGSWDFLRDRPGAWFRLIEPDASADGHSPWEGDAEELAPHLLGVGRRMTLLDEQRQRVIGYPTMYAHSQQRELVVGGRTVGWLVLAPIESVTDAAALRFRDEQFNATLTTGVIAVLMAAVIAWWVALRLLQPIRTVAQATKRLTDGQYDTRVDIDRSDEVGQLAHDFNQLAHTLGRNERLRRDYIADISHELRTPLAVLRGELEAMEDGIHPNTPQAISMLLQEAQTLGQLVDDLHELAMADVGTLQHRPESVDLAVLLHQQAQLFAPRCEARGLALQWHNNPPLVVLGDPARLRQVLHNLLDNALRYTHAPGVVRISLRQAAPWAQIHIEDSAPGVASELLPRLFERFFRVEASRSRHSGGSGLGLPICESLIRAHGGRITARHSGLGGLCVEVLLPLAPARSLN